jgi:hypothetical protein
VSVRIQLAQDGVEMGLQPPAELMTDNLNVRELHVGVQLNDNELGQDIAFGRYQQTGKNLEVKACLNDHGLTLFGRSAKRQG